MDPKILSAVQTELDLMNEKWQRNERRQKMYSFSAPHLLVLEEKVSKMRNSWYTGEIAPADFIKIAAIAIRALEEVTDEVFINRGSKQ